MNAHKVTLVPLLGHYLVIPIVIRAVVVFKIKIRYTIFICNNVYHGNEPLNTSVCHDVRERSRSRSFSIPGGKTFVLPSVIVAF